MKNSLLKNNVLSLLIVIWTILSLFYKSNRIEVYVIINLILASVFVTMIGFNIAAKKPEIVFFKLFTGLFEIFAGLLILIVKMNFIMGIVFLLIGCELFGISLGLILLDNKSAIITASTNRPEPLSPDPTPKPNPF